LADFYFEMGDYAQAEPLFQQALEIQRAALPELHPEVAQSLNDLAELYRNMGEYAMAEPLFQQALAIWRAALGEQHPIVASALNNLAVLYDATNRQNEAWSFVQRSAVIGDHLIGQIFSIGSERQRMAYLATLLANFEASLSLVLQHFPHASERAQAAVDLVLRRKAIGVEALAAQRDVLLEGHYPDLLPVLQELTILRGQIALKSMAGPGSESLEMYRQKLDA
jgi:tetratricopeptide (TPR) repeat protein